MNYYVMAIKQYAKFSGRASRREFWMFTLVNFLVLLGLGFFIGVTSGFVGTMLSDLYMLFILLPSLSIQARRLHDIDMSAWWMLLYLIPFIGSIILLIMDLVGGDQGSNKYGPVSNAR